MRDAFIEEITAAAAQDRTIYFISADMGAMALDRFRELLPDQFIYAGISEQNMMDVAAGLAASGKTVYTYAMASFITARCFEQLRYSIAMMGLPMTVLGVGVGLGYEDAGPAHYTTDDIACMRLLHGLEIYSPADTESARAIAHLTYTTPAFRYIRLERPALPDIYSDGFATSLPQGMCELERGETTCVLASGYMLHRALQVARRLRQEGIHVGVIDLYRVAPINEEGLLEMLSGYTNVVTLEEQSLPGGFGSAIAEVLIDANADKRIVRLGLPGRYIFENGGRDYLLSACGLSVAQIADRIRKLACSDDVVSVLHAVT
jgi:transketolase